MSLNYDLTKVAADYDDDAVWPITNALIWGTMSVGMNSISEVDWKEFYRRCYMIETIHGSWLNFNGKPRPITPEDVKSHIGLKTNASNLTNAKFKNDIDRRLRYAADTILR